VDVSQPGEHEQDTDHSDGFHRHEKIMREREELSDVSDPEDDTHERDTYEKPTVRTSILLPDGVRFRRCVQATQENDRR
jgi:hypothetical protein